MSRLVLRAAASSSRTRFVYPALMTASRPAIDRSGFTRTRGVSSLPGCLAPTQGCRVDGVGPGELLGKLKIGNHGRKPFSAMFTKPNWKLVIFLVMLMKPS